MERLRLGAEDGTQVIGDARMNLAAWLRAGRDRRKLSIEDVAKITKIQARILEKLENGQLDGLPAEVFVKGFVRSFAKCVGLDESEALDKYSAAQAGASVPQPSVAIAKALAETMARPVDVETVIEAKRVAQGTPVEPAPVVVAIEPIIAAPAVAVDAPLVIDAPIEIATPVVEAAAPVGQSSEASKKKRSRKNAKQRNRKRKEAQAAKQDAIETAVFEKPAIDVESIEASSIEAKTTEEIVEAAPAIDAVVETPAFAEGSARISQSEIAAVEQEIIEAAAEPELVIPVVEDEPLPSGTWQPTMPAPVTTSVPWRRPNLPAQAASTYVVPSLVIDDADPDSADRERDDRAVKEPHRLSFLPPILMDREDRSSRQGGLTLAVILLLIAATLTLSYLMRRPSPSGDGVTILETAATLQA